MPDQRLARLRAEARHQVKHAFRQPGRLDHLCLVIAPTDLDELAHHGPFDVIEGPCTRFGAQGNGTSLYVRDPDGTTVELRHYE